MNEFINQIHAAAKWNRKLMYLENYNAVVFEPILYIFRKSHLCQVSKKVINLSESLHKIENLRLLTQYKCLISQT